METRLGAHGGDPKPAEAPATAPVPTALRTWIGGLARRSTPSRLASTAPSAPRVSATISAPPRATSSRASASSSADVAALRPNRFSSSRLLGFTR